MVLEAGGHFWRFHDSGGTQGVEALQAFVSMDEMSWVKGTLEQYSRRVPTTPAVAPGPVR